MAVRPSGGLFPLQAGPSPTRMKAAAALPLLGLAAHPLRSWSLLMLGVILCHEPTLAPGECHEVSVGPNLKSIKVFPARDFSMSHVSTPPNLLSVAYLPVGAFWQPAGHWWNCETILATEIYLYDEVWIHFSFYFELFSTYQCYRIIYLRAENCYKDMCPNWT